MKSHLLVMNGLLQIRLDLLVRRRVNRYFIKQLNSMTQRITVFGMDSMGRVFHTSLPLQARLFKGCCVISYLIKPTIFFTPNHFVEIFVI